MTIYYTKEHEWVGVEGDDATVGITDFAQGQLGDVVFVEVPEAAIRLAARWMVGRQGRIRRLRAGLGTVTEGNQALVDIHPDRHTFRGEGWFFAPLRQSRVSA